MKSIYWLSFFVPPRDGERTLFWHQLRDAEGFIYLREALSRAIPRSRFAGILRNVPECPPPDRFGPDDLLVSTTRFPLDDDEEYDLRKVIRGGSLLEERLGIPRSVAPDGAGCRIFQQLTRSFAILQPGIAKLLPKDQTKYADIRFSTKRGARCSDYNRRSAPADSQRTAAYLISIPQVWPDGPGLVWSFGLSGETGLIWNKLVADEFVDTLKSPCFVLAEFDIPERILGPRQGNDMGPGDFEDITADSQNLTCIVQTKLTPDRLAELGF